MAAVFRRAGSWMKANPFKFGVGVATGKTAAADLLVQTQLEKKEKVDWRRVGLFTCFGFAYLGCFQYVLYVTAFKRMFPGMEKFAALSFREKLSNREGHKLILKQVCFDCFIHPLWFFPIYYSMKESVQGDTSLALTDNIGIALEKYKTNAWGDWTSFWKIWMIGDCFVFALPLWARLPANHSISFVYVCVLSFMRGAPIEDKTENDKNKIVKVENA